MVIPTRLFIDNAAILETFVQIIAAIAVVFDESAVFIRF